MKAQNSKEHASCDDLTLPAPADEYSIYIHLPFCERKCPYCNFFVLLPTEKKIDDLSNALLTEWRQRKTLIHTHQLRSIYFGGGTPSLFPLPHLKRLLEAFAPSGDVEVTIEVNPEHATTSFFSSLLDLGVNRISLGAQSLEKSTLQLLGRKHDPETIELSIRAAQKAGFGNISIDLMYELPDQTAEQWQKSLAQVMDWPIQHLSFYNLTIEPKTPFYQRRGDLLIRSPQPQECAQMFDMIETNTSNREWERYEISALSRPGFHSRHNSGYWRGRSYLGLGPSAHSFWGGKRWENGRDWKRYLDAASKAMENVQQEDVLGEHERRRELFLIHLRLSKGVDLRAFQRRWGRMPHTMCRLMHFVERGDMRLEGDLICLTNRGRRGYDTIASELI